MNQHSMPLRRLVVTGKDTPENLALFFGSESSDSDSGSGSIRELHEDCRFEVLLEPPPGSPKYKMAQHMRWDVGCPQPWTPRAASADEERQVAEIRAAQEDIRRHVAAQGRGVENLTSQDTRDVLVQQYGDNWVAGVKTHTRARNSMYQGV